MLLRRAEQVDPPSRAEWEEPRASLQACVAQGEAQVEAPEKKKKQKKKKANDHEPEPPKRSTRSR